MTALAVIAAAELLVIVALVWAGARATRDHIALVDRLCQRLQAPGAAVLEHDERMRGRRPDEYAPPAIPPDDDEAFWLSRERLADAMMEAEQRDRAGASA